MPHNKPTKVLIVDDEKKACTNLYTILKEYIDLDILIAGVANSAWEAELLIREHKPDALFLDIEMPNENAFTFLDRIAPVDFEVVFVTAYDEYALRAFKLNAIDYILKPISIPELKKAYQKLQDRLKYKQLVSEQRISYSELNEQVQDKAKPRKIALRDNTTTELVDFMDILFVEAQSSYSKIVFMKQKVVKEMTLSNPLSDYEAMLPEALFYRIHRSFLINCKHIKRIVNEANSQVIMKNDLAIPVSRRRYASLIDYLKTRD